MHVIVGCVVFSVQKPAGAEAESLSGEGPSTPSTAAGGKGSKAKKAPTTESLLAKRKKLWHAIVKKDISKAAKARTNARKEMMSNAKKVLSRTTRTDCISKKCTTIFIVVGITTMVRCMLLSI